MKKGKVVKDTALVSVIIPMYNSEQYIERCILSLSKQKYRSIEILVVDDGSTDQGEKIVKKLQSGDRRISYIYQENSGPGRARNHAVDVSSGKYLLFVDSDDYLSNDYILDLVNQAEDNEAELIIGGYTLIYSDRKKKEEFVPEYYKKNEAEEWAYRISSTCSRLYLKDFWMKHNIKFSEEKGARAEDVPIVLFTNVMAKNIATVANSGYFYYQHNQSAMHSKAKTPFFFPYNEFDKMYHNIRNRKVENSLDFWYIGILKFLAFFRFIIYRRTSRTEKKRFFLYIQELIGDDFNDMLFVWRKKRGYIDLPHIHKMAIDIFILYYKIFSNVKDLK